MGITSARIRFVGRYHQNVCQDCHFCLIGAVSAAPKPEAEADPQFYAGHPFGHPYVAPVVYNPVVPVCTTVEEELRSKLALPESKMSAPPPMSPAKKSLMKSNVKKSWKRTAPPEPLPLPLLF